MSDDATTKARMMIYVPAALDERIRRAAEAAGQSLSVWIQRAAEQALRAQLPEFSSRRGKGQ